MYPNIKKEIKELKKIATELNDKLEKLSQEEAEREPKYSKPRPFFVKGHHLPPIVITKESDPFFGRYLILKILCKSKKPLTIQEISEKSGRSVRLESVYISKLIKSGLVQKEGDKYKPTEKGLSLYNALAGSK